MKKEAVYIYYTSFMSFANKTVCIVKILIEIKLYVFVWQHYYAITNVKFHLLSSQKQGGKQLTSCIISRTLLPACASIKLYFRTRKLKQINTKCAV